MNVARILTEGMPSYRFRSGRLMTRYVYSRAFHSIGEDTVIMKPRTLRNVMGASIGQRCTVFPGLWLQCENADSRIEVGNDAYIGFGAHIHATGSVIIGDHLVIHDNVTITDGTHAPLVFQKVTSKGHILIGDYVSIGIGVTILGGVTIGTEAQIGAGAVVVDDVAPGQRVVGIPARPLS